MSTTAPTYTERRPLRRLERLWSRGEGFVNRLSAAAQPLRPYNPLYHLGPLVIYLLALLCVTGILLLIVYRPGIGRAYESVQGLSANWLGSVLRSVHRYGSDALIVVAFLHALKMLLSDRFWGSRTLAWVSGWLLIVLFWLTGSMGYFLVWDTAAQWLTEFAVDAFGGAFALSFFGPQAAGRTYSFFVIILFLHAFLPLIIAIGVLVHVLRLQRPRYWAPRWLMIAATAALVLLSVLFPAMSNLPADLRRVIGAAQLDWWYLGFLPLSERLGQPGFWGISLALLGLVSALPWLLRGRHNGPSAIDDSKCTGCATCARECPYNAIDMVQRENGGKAQLAVVKGSLCTGCGICVAACPEDAIDLRWLELGALRGQVRDAIAEARAGGAAPLLIYACERHATLGSVPALQSDRVRLMAAAPGSPIDLSAARPFGPAPRKAGPRSWAVALALLTLLFAAAILANRPAAAASPAAGQLRLAINHHGDLLANARELPPDIATRLPPGVNPAAVLGGERFPIRLQLIVDAETVVDAAYRAGGLRREGSVYELETLPLAPGERRVTINLSDDGGDPRPVFDRVVEIAAGETLVLVFDPVQEVFLPWE